MGRLTETDLRKAIDRLRKNNNPTKDEGWMDFKRGYFEKLNKYFDSWEYKAMIKWKKRNGL